MSFSQEEKMLAATALVIYKIELVDSGGLRSDFECLPGRVDVIEKHGQQHVKNLNQFLMRLQQFEDLIRTIAA